MRFRFAHEPLQGRVGRQLMAAYEAEILSLYPTWDARVGIEPAQYRPPAGAFVVAYADGGPAGCGGLRRWDERIAEVKRMYVVPAARGAGLGRLLLARLELQAGRLGYTTTRLDTGGRQPEALAIYRAAGYREIPDYNGNPTASFWFEKALAPGGRC